MDIFAGIDGYVLRQAESTWDDAHDVATGDAASSVLTASAFALRASLTGPGRGSGYYIGRCFFSFNTIPITHVPKSVKFGVYGYSNNAITAIHCVKATSDIEDGISTADFDSIEGWDARFDNTGNVTYYAHTSSAWTTSGYNQFQLNQQALVDITGQDKLNICLLVQRDIDNTGGEVPPPTSTEYSGCYFRNYTGTSRDPKLIITEQDDAVFFGANF